MGIRSFTAKQTMKKLKKNFVKTIQRSENPSVGTLEKGRIVTYIGYGLMAWACLELPRFSKCPGELGGRDTVDAKSEYLDNGIVVQLLVPVGCSDKN